MRRTAVLLVAICLVEAITRGAKADGTIILNKAQAFQTEINNGTITGATVNLMSTPQQIASNAALGTAYPGQTKVDSSTDANSRWGGLLSAATPGSQGQYATSWTYGYHIDPDLTNYTISLGLYLPQVATSPSASGIDRVTIALTSVATVNNQQVYSSRVWGFDNTLTPSVLNPDPTTHLEEFSLAAVDGAGAGGSNYFSQDSGFNIQNVWYVSIGYSGMFDSAYPVTPEGANALWTDATSLDVLQTPEPNSALVLACGLLGAGLLRHSQRTRSRRRNGLSC